MKAWQRVIRERIADSGGDLFGRWWDGLDNSLSSATVREISPQEAATIILEYEWLGDMPQATKQCFGMYHGPFLAGALVFAEKPGANLSSNDTSIVPKDAHYLARGACAHWAHPHAASWFIAKVCNELLCPDGGTVLAYSDPAAGEIGTIYQSLGWYYLGPSQGGPNAVLVDGKLMTLRSFHRDRGNGGKSIAAVRAAFPNAKTIEPVPRRHRYLGVYGSGKFKREIAKRLRGHSRPYPKRDKSQERDGGDQPQGVGQFDGSAPL